MSRMKDFAIRCEMDGTDPTATLRAMGACQDRPTAQPPDPAALPDGRPHERDGEPDGGTCGRCGAALWADRPHRQPCPGCDTCAWPQVSVVAAPDATALPDAALRERVRFWRAEANRSATAEGRALARAYLLAYAGERARRSAALWRRPSRPCRTRPYAGERARRSAALAEAGSWGDVGM